MRHRFNPRKQVNDDQRYSMLTVLALRSMSCTMGNSSSLQASGDDHSCRYYNPQSAKKDILKNFCVSDGDKCYDENMSPKKLLKFRIWFRQWRIAHVRSESYAKAEFFRMPNFPNCGFNTRHDNRKVTLIEFFENRICPNIYRMFRSVEWTTTW